MQKYILAQSPHWTGLSPSNAESHEVFTFSTPVFQLNTHPLLHLRPQGITKILRELIRYRKVSIKNLQFVIYCSFAILSDSQDP